MNKKVFDDILDLNEKIDENGKIISLKEEKIFKEIDEPILLCDMIDQKEDDDSNEKFNPIKTILQKLNRSSASLIKPNKENEYHENDLYENFFKNKTKIDDNLKSMISDLSSEKIIDIKNEKPNKLINFSIFSSEDEIFSIIFEQTKILFLKPIMDLSFLTLNEDSKINSDLFAYIDFYIESNIEFLINNFSNKFFAFISGADNSIIYTSEYKIKESEDYIVFVKKAYQRFENLSMFHFKFLDSKIDFLNSCLQNLVFLVLQINFSHNSSNHDQIKNFLEKFFRKIFVKKNENNEEFCF